MKHLLHPLIAIGLLFTLTATKCMKVAETTVPLQGGRWNLQTISGQAVKMPDGKENPHITIATDGQLSGNGGCNQLMGSAKVEGSALSFPGVGSTKMFCADTQEIENAFLRILRATNSYRIEGNKLTLLDKDSELATLSQ